MRFDAIGVSPFSAKVLYGRGQQLRGSDTMTPMRPDERTAVLTIGVRAGSFSGVVQHRSFQVVRVDSGNSVGTEVTSRTAGELARGDEEIQVSIQ